MNRRKPICFLMIIMLLLTGCTQLGSKDAKSLSSNRIEKDEIIQQLETSQFIFYSKEQDKGCLKELSNSLDENYTRITKDLKTPLDKKLNIYIYSDLNTYHKAINRPDDPNWAFASAALDTGAIHMVNPLNMDGYSYSDLMKSIVHEFVHVVVHNINTNIPKSLDEGVAAYESGLDGGVDQTIAEAKKNNKFPSLKDLDTDTITFGKINGYQFSYLLTEYAIKTYGYDKLIALIKTPSEFEKIFGLTREDFEKGWIAWVCK